MSHFAVVLDTREEKLNNNIFDALGVDSQILFPVEL